LGLQAMVKISQVQLRMKTFMQRNSTPRKVISGALSFYQTLQVFVDVNSKDNTVSANSEW